MANTPGQHDQRTANSSRVQLQNISVANGGSATAQTIIAPPPGEMRTVANQVLTANGKALLTKTYAPNEMASMMHDLLNGLGL